MSLSFQVNKLHLLLTAISINPSEILATKSILHEQLHSLTQRFNSLAVDDNCDCEEANAKHTAHSTTDTATNLKYISLLRNIDELVSSRRILIHVSYCFYFYKMNFN